MVEPLQILMIHDDPDERLPMQRELREEFGSIEPIQIHDQTQLERALRAGGFDLVITDDSLRWTDALAVLRAVREKLPDCPVVMVTGTGTLALAVEAMKLGLDDYVVMGPGREDRLREAARAALGKARMRIERRRAEEALRQSEERLRQMAERIDQAFYISSFQPKRILYASPAYEKIWGRTCESLYQDPLSWLEGIEPEDRPQVESAARNGLGAGAYTIEYRVRRTDGSVRWVEDRGFEVRDESGRPYRMVGAATDITERRLAEESREKLASFTASGIHPVLEVDAAGSITYHNEAAKVIIDALESTEPHESLRAEIRSIVADCLGRRESIIGLETLVQGRTFSWAFIPVPNRQLVHAYVTDISHHLELEARLRQSEKMEAIGRLAGGVAHDFGNLLTVIFGYAGFLQEQLPNGSPLKADVDEIRKAAERAAELGSQLLAFGRRQVVSPEVLDPNPVVGRTLAMLRRLMPENIDLVFDPAAEPGPVRIDRGQLEQAIMNLTLNARDAMPGGGRVTVRTANVDLQRGYTPRHIGLPPGSYTALSVADSGSGIGRDTMTHLFEPFYTTKEPGRGTGLGLATVHGIIKQAGGDVWVDTEVGRGSTFTIYLPRVLREPLATESARVATITEAGSETILLVEDDRKIRDMAARALRSRGYEVLEAEHGADALDRSRRHEGPIHLLVSDLVMPVMGGSVLAGRLTAERPDTKVLYISGYAGDTSRPERAGAVEGACLPKPFTPANLISKVRETLDGASSV